MAGSAVAATWLRASGAAPRPWGLPGGVAGRDPRRSPRSSASRSPASSIMAAALLPLLLARLPARAWILAGRAAPAPGPRPAWRPLLAARRGFDPAALRLDARDFFRAFSKGVVHLAAGPLRGLPARRPATARSWAGAGPDWGPGGRPFVNPVNLGFWLLAFGMYGIVGLVASAAAWLAPAARAVRPAPGSPMARPGRGGLRPRWSPCWRSISSTA